MNKKITHRQCVNFKCMTKEQTTILKGVAILLMLFFHLFNRLGNAALCTDITLMGNPLCHILSRASNPVFFFLILSGYGLYMSNHRAGGDKNHYRRIWSLMKNYWLTLLIFVPIGFLLGKDGYPGDLRTIIENVTSYRVSWNHEVWFLFPYVMLALLAPCIVSIVDRIGICHSIGVGIITMFLSMCVFHFIGESTIRHNYFWAYNPIMLLHFIMPFLVGCSYAKYNVEKNPPPSSRKS